MANRLALDRKATAIARPLSKDERALFSTITAVGGNMARDPHLMMPLMDALRPQKVTSLFSLMRSPQRAPARDLMVDPRTVSALKQDPLAFGVVAHSLNGGYLSKDQALKLLDAIGREPVVARIVRANPRPTFFRAFSSEGFRTLSQHLNPTSASSSRSRR